MQAVNVLSDHTADPSLIDQMSDRPVASIGFGRGYGFIDRDLAAPCFSPHLFRSEEVAEVDWLVFGPEASGASEVGDSGFGADSCAGEDSGAAALGEHSLQLVNTLLVREIRHLSALYSTTFQACVFFGKKFIEHMTELFFLSLQVFERLRVRFKFHRDALDHFQVRFPQRFDLIGVV